MVELSASLRARSACTLQLCAVWSRCCSRAPMPRNRKEALATKTAASGTTTMGSIELRCCNSGFVDHNRSRAFLRCVIRTARDAARSGPKLGRKGGRLRQDLRIGRLLAHAAALQAQKVNRTFKIANFARRRPTMVGGAGPRSSELSQL